MRVCARCPCHDALPYRTCASGDSTIHDVSSTAFSALGGVCEAGRHAPINGTRQPFDVPFGAKQASTQPPLPLGGTSSGTCFCKSHSGVAGMRTQTQAAGCTSDGTRLGAQIRRVCGDAPRVRRADCVGGGDSFAGLLGLT